MQFISACVFVMASLTTQGPGCVSYVDRGNWGSWKIVNTNNHTGWSTTGLLRHPGLHPTGRLLVSLFFFFFFFWCVAYFSPSRFSFSLAFLGSLWSASAHQITSRYNSKTLSSHTNTQELLFFVFFLSGLCVQVVCISLCLLQRGVKTESAVHATFSHRHADTILNTKAPIAQLQTHIFCTHKKKTLAHLKRGLCLRGPRQLPADTQASDWWDAGGAGVDFVSCS